MPWDVQLATSELASIWQVEESKANALLLSNLRALVTKK
jgi:hypothetical protein